MRLFPPHPSPAADAWLAEYYGLVAQGAPPRVELLDPVYGNETTLQIHRPITGVQSLYRDTDTPIIALSWDEITVTLTAEHAARLHQLLGPALEDSTS